MYKFKLLAFVTGLSLAACGESATTSTAKDTTQTVDTTGDAASVTDATTATDAASTPNDATATKGSPAGACLVSDTACVSSCKAKQCAAEQAAYAADPKASVLAGCVVACKSAGAPSAAAPCVAKCLDTAGKGSVAVLVDQQVCEATQCWKCDTDDAACVDSCAGQRCTEAGLACLADAQCAGCLSDKGVAVGCIGNLPAGSAAKAAGEALVTCAVAEVPGCQGK